MRFQKSVVVISTSLAFATFALATLGGAGSTAWAMGKKPTPPANGGGCTPGGDTGFTTPNPVRKVVLKPVTTQAFNLPNGSRVELSADLGLLLNTAVTGTNLFAPTDAVGGTGNDVCGNRIEIRAGVSTLVLNAFELGASIGYTPSGETGSLTGLTGKTNIRVGTIAMDFSVWECTGGTCSAVAATTASSMTAGVDLSLEIDFGVVKTAPDLVFNTPLGNILRNIMNDGLKQLSKSSRLSELSWTARVREFLPEAGTLIFDAGLQSRLQPNQAFVIYAVTPSTGACNVYKAMAHVHTTSVEPVSSTAVVDEILDSRGIRDGDVVMIRPVASVAGR